MSNQASRPNGKYYHLCWCRPFRDKQGEERTDFMRVGTAWPLREKDGFSIEMTMPMHIPLRGAKFVLLAAEPRPKRTTGADSEPEFDALDDDQMPF